MVRQAPGVLFVPAPLYHVFFFLLSVGLSVLCGVLYHDHGYSTKVLLFWALSILCGAFAFGQISGRASGAHFYFRFRDWLRALTVTLLVMPLLVSSLRWVPLEVNTDEVVLISYVRDAQVKNWFELYGHNPAPPFKLYRWAADLMGGITLFNMRLVHAVLASVSVGACYLLFRLFASPGFSFYAAIVLATGHVYTAVCRLAMEDVLIILNPVAAYLVFLIGLRNRSLLLSFGGGVLAGLGFYQYYPARLIIFIWLAFVLVLLCARRIEWRYLLKSAAVTLFAFGLTIMPMVLTTLKDPVGLTDYAAKQILLFQKGREFQKGWVYSRTIGEAYRKNVWQGLTVFNSRTTDKAYHYINPRVGFFDTVSGLFLWLGLLVVLWKRKRSWRQLFMPTVFILLYLIFGFISSKNPNYNRMLLILPWAAFFVARGIRTLVRICCRGEPWKDRRQGAVVGRWVFVLTVLWLTGINQGLYFLHEKDFAKTGFDEFTWTFRYADLHRNDVNRAYVMVTDHTHPFFRWGGEYWLRSLITENQTLLNYDLGQFRALLKKTATGLSTEFSNRSDLTIMLHRNFWDSLKPELFRYFPRYRVLRIEGVDHLVVLEIHRK